MPVQATVYSDCLCAWCYVGQGRVDRLRAEYGVEVTWRPFALYPAIPPQGLHAPSHFRANFRTVEPHLRAIAEEAGLPLALPKFIPRSRPALEASEHARALGRHEAFHRAVFHRFFGLGQEISDRAVLRDAALEAGPDPEAMQAETERGRYRTVVDRQHARAVFMGVSGVPPLSLTSASP